MSDLNLLDGSNVIKDTRGGGGDAAGSARNTRCCSTVVHGDFILSTGRLESLQPFNASVCLSQLKGFQNFEK
jgi:hypothetical protein